MAVLNYRPVLLRILFVTGVGASALFIVCGFWIIQWASPSPHGYIELFFGVPLIGTGGILGGATVLLNWTRINWPVRVVGIVVLAGGFFVFGSIVVLIV